MNTNYLAIFSLLAAVLCIWACKPADSYNYIITTDKSKPGIVTNVEVSDFNGGSYITYTLPKSDALLYVLAEYKINDTSSREVKASYYTDTIKVDGFAQNREYEVTLYAVSRAEVKSDPVTVKVHPNVPPYLLAAPTIAIDPDFGGVHVSVTNEMKQPIGIVLLSPNENNELEPVDQVYSKDSLIAFSQRGYNTDPRVFGVYITDHWGNRSDTIFSTISPLFEMRLDKTKFQEHSLPSDANPYQNGTAWTMPHLWDENINTGYHTQLPTDLPLTFTFDLGVRAKLSRYTLWDRGGQYIAAFGNPKRWAVWGSNEPKDEKFPPDVNGLAIGQVIGNWVYMGEFISPPKPSGLPDGQNSAEDVAWNTAGFEFNFSIDVPPVRYLRFQAFESYGGGNFIHIMEITLWGVEE